MHGYSVKRIAQWAALGALAAVVAASFALGWSLTGQATAQNSQQLLYWYCFAQTEDGVTYFSRTGRADTRAAAESTFRLVATTEATSQGKKLATLSCGSEWPDRADELYASAGDLTALTDAVAALTARVAALESAAPAAGASPAPAASPTPEATPAATPAATGGAPDRATQLAAARRAAGEDAVLPELGEDGVSLSCPDGYELSTSGNRSGCLRTQQPDGYYLQLPRSRWPAGNPSYWPPHPETTGRHGRTWSTPRAWFECRWQTEHALDFDPDYPFTYFVWAEDARMAEAQLRAVYPIGWGQNRYQELSHGDWDDPATFWYSEEETRRNLITSHLGCRAYRVAALESAAPAPAPANPQPGDDDDSGDNPTPTPTPTASPTPEATPTRPEGWPAVRSPGSVLWDCQFRSRDIDTGFVRLGSNNLWAVDAEEAHAVMDAVAPIGHILGNRVVISHGDCTIRQ